MEFWIGNLKIKAFLFSYAKQRSSEALSLSSMTLDIS